MPIFLPGPLSSRSWVLPGPAVAGRVVAAIRPGRPLRRAVEARTVIVTGASSGIGAATAEKLGAAGAHVLLVARSADALEERAAAIRDAGGRADALACDLCDAEAIDALVSRVCADFGGVDVLVNNAGRSIRRSVHRSFDRPHDFERTMALNYFASLRLILGFLPGMRERRHGQVVNVSTMGVQMGAPRFAAYIASKAALEAFTRILAAEVEAYGIACTTVHMPLVRTPMIAPTGAYRRAPALSADDAADILCEAIRTRPAQVDLPIGVAGELAGILSPGLSTRARRLAFHATRDSRAARGE